MFNGVSTCLIPTIKHSVAPLVHGDALSICAVELALVARVEVQGGHDVSLPKARVAVDRPLPLPKGIVGRVCRRVGAVCAMQLDRPRSDPLVVEEDRVAVPPQDVGGVLHLAPPAVLDIKLGAKAEPFSGERYSSNKYHKNRVIKEYL